MVLADTIFHKGLGSAGKCPHLIGWIIRLRALWASNSLAD